MLGIILGFALLASAFTANKLILMEISPLFFVGIRMIIPGMILVGYYLKKGSANLSWQHLKKDRKDLFIICVCTTFVPALLKAFALKHLISSEAVLIGSLDPFVTAVYAYFLFSEQLSARKFVGIAIGFVSIALLLSSKHPLFEQVGQFKLFSLPVLAAFSAVIIGRYGWIITQKLLKLERYQPPEINGISMLISGMLAMTTSIATATTPSMDVLMSSSVLLPLAYTVIVGNLIAYNLYAYFLKMYKVTLISFIGFTIPIMSHFYGHLILNEPLSWKFFITVGIASLGLRIYSSEKTQPLKESA